MDEEQSSLLENGEGKGEEKKVEDVVAAEKCCLCFAMGVGIKIMASLTILGALAIMSASISMAFNSIIAFVLMFLSGIPQYLSAYLFIQWLTNDNRGNRDWLAKCCLFNMISSSLVSVVLLLYARGLFNTDGNITTVEVEMEVLIVACFVI